MMADSGKSAKLNLATYLDMIKEGKMDQATQYKNSFIPKNLYKYNFLFDPRYSNFEIDNEIRFDTIENNRIWLSSGKNLNDPYEFKALILDEQTIQEQGWNISQIKMILDSIRKRFGVSCFSNNFKSNMPMWAHYSNNHQGFCVEYDIDNPDLLLPVLYEKNRIKTAAILPNMITEIMDSLNGINGSSNNIKMLMTMVFLANCVKHDTWEYEQEYRILYPFLEQIVKGKRAIEF